MQLLNNGQTVKSEAETTKFIHNVILAPFFNQADLTNFDAHHENQQLDKALSQSTLWSQFIESSVEILVPSGETVVHQYFSILVSMGFSPVATCRNQRKPRNLETWKPISTFLETSQYGEQQKPQKPMKTYGNYGN